MESQWFPTKPISTTESQQRPSVQSALRISFRTVTMSSRSLIFDVLVYSVHISSSSNLILKINSRRGDHWCIAGHLCSARCLCCTDFSFSQCMFQTHRTVPQVKQKWTCSMKSNCCLRSLSTTTTMLWTLVRMPFYKFIRNVLKLLFHSRKNN